MNPQIVFFFVIISINCIASSEFISTIAKILHDVVKSDENPTILLTLMCWTIKQHAVFSKLIGIPTEMLTKRKNITNQLTNQDVNIFRVLVDMRCVGNEQFLWQIDEIYFGRPYRWILLQPNPRDLMNLTILPDSDVLIIRTNEKLDQYNLEHGK